MSEETLITLIDFNKKHGIRKESKLRKALYEATSNRSWRGVKIQCWETESKRYLKYRETDIMKIANMLGITMTNELPLDKRLETITEEYISCKDFRKVFPEVHRDFASKAMAKALQRMRRGEKVCIQEQGKQCLFKKEFLVTIAEHFGMNFAPEKSTEQKQEQEATPQEHADTKQEPTLLAAVLDCRRILQELLEAWKGEKQ